MVRIAGANHRRGMASTKYLVARNNSSSTGGRVAMAL